MSYPGRWIWSEQRLARVRTLKGEKLSTIFNNVYRCKTRIDYKSRVLRWKYGLQKRMESTCRTITNRILAQIVPLYELRVPPAYSRLGEYGKLSFKSCLNHQSIFVNLFSNLERGLRKLPSPYKIKMEGPHLCERWTTGLVQSYLMLTSNVFVLRLFRKSTSKIRWKPHRWKTNARARAFLSTLWWGSLNV